ncbi:TetR/AcrR family transcriptional regulator [Antribacter sp. KLBMP9083]|uniref:TetR/AcrR family transcriptional regulator n=1 Tax=Antribacter soli TaxID=2910976 RepID=A0AA41QFP4_9MICO|nr:TetR/AcrR family transcriptional regulator [Antribacter soli]MCF4122613.1 TetR/AcrR family transcriptional regulator [Antribacter soli]
MTISPRPLRADAERNRRAIVDAAGTVFAKEGTAVTLEHIADVAGVGVGTIYRRFSSVEELVAVVLEEKMTRYADRTEQAAQQALTEPWEAFGDYVLFMLEQQATDLAFSEVILAPATATDLFRSEIGRALDASIQLVDRAKEAGAIREDFDHSDLYLLLNANAGLIRGAGRSAPDAWRRFGQYLLQAFRERGTETLAAPPAAWARAGRARRTAPKQPDEAPVRQVTEPPA